MCLLRRWKKILRNYFNKFKIDFKTTLIPYRVNTHWIEKKLIEMKDVLNLDEPPKIEKTCEKCAYLEGGKKF